MCAACHTLKELLELKPDYLVESASPAAMKELALPTLENGTSIITLSIGALADTSFMRKSKKQPRQTIHGFTWYPEPSEDLMY